MNDNLAYNRSLYRRKVDFDSKTTKISDDGCSHISCFHVWNELGFSCMQEIKNSREQIRRLRSESIQDCIKEDSLKNELSQLKK